MTASYLVEFSIDENQTQDARVLAYLYGFKGSPGIMAKVWFLERMKQEFKALEALPSRKREMELIRENVEITAQFQFQDKEKKAYTFEQGKGKEVKRWRRMIRKFVAILSWLSAFAMLWLMILRVLPWSWQNSLVMFSFLLTGMIQASIIETHEREKRNVSKPEIFYTPDKKPPL